MAESKVFDPKGPVGPGRVAARTRRELKKSRVIRFGARRRRFKFQRRKLRWWRRGWARTAWRRKRRSRFRFRRKRRGERWFSESRKEEGLPFKLRLAGFFPEHPIVVRPPGIDTFYKPTQCLIRATGTTNITDGYIAFCHIRERNLTRVSYVGDKRVLSWVRFRADEAGNIVIDNSVGKTRELRFAGFSRRWFRVGDRLSLVLIPPGGKQYFHLLGEKPSATEMTQGATISRQVTVLGKRRRQEEKGAPTAEVRIPKDVGFIRLEGTIDVQARISS